MPTYLFVIKDKVILPFVTFIKLEHIYIIPFYNIKNTDVVTGNNMT